MLLPFDPISLCTWQTSAGILQGLGAKIKSCLPTDQSSSTTAIHHLSSFVLLTLAVPQLGPQSFLSCIVFCRCSAILTMLCNPHDTTGSRDAPPPTILPLLLHCAHTFQSRAFVGRRTSRWQSAPLPPPLPSHHRSLLKPKIQPILYTSTGLSIPSSAK